jgi:hypothetical protein
MLSTGVAAQVSALFVAPVDVLSWLTTPVQFLKFCLERPRGSVPL